MNDLHLPSLFVGFAGALVAFLLLTLVFKTGKLVLKIALFVALVAIFGGGYFTWIKG